jgi:hypothetical protein
MPGGGAKPGERRGGRKKGSSNKRTEQRLAAMQEAVKKIEAALPDAFEGDSHALLASIYKDPSQPIQLRMDAAKAAIAYERPRLAATELSGGLGIKTHEEWLCELD